MKAFLSKLGQSFMLPIALLPAAGIFLGLGGSFTSPDMIASYGLENILGEGTLLNSILLILKAAGDIVFANLPLLFAIALAVGFAKKEKGSAALAAVMSFLIMNVIIATTINLFDLTKVVGDETVLFIFGNEYPGMLASTLGIDGTLNMGVFGGIIAGGITAVLHNRFYNVQLPQFLGFFGGPRFVPIISSFAALFYGVLLVLVWPVIGSVFAIIGTFVGTLQEDGLGWLASLIHGIVERSLIPFGLHHVYYLPLWQTSVGGTYEIAGQAFAGTQNAFFAALSSGDFTNFPSTNFMTGKFPFMMFGLPAAAYAMYRLTDENNRKAAAGLYFSIALTAFLTGITEPIEFTFLFLAPALYYGLHVPLAGISFALMDILGVKIGQTFSGGFIDYFLFGLLPGFGGVDNKWYYVILVGIIYVPIYYFLFTFYIKRFDLAVPGRNGADIKTTSKSEIRKDIADSSNDLVNGIVQGLGGLDNIDSIDACITRLRVTVKDSSIVNPEQDFWKKELDASGIVINGKAIQVIYGDKAVIYKTEIEHLLGD